MNGEHMTDACVMPPPRRIVRADRANALEQPCNRACGSRKCSNAAKGRVLWSIGPCVVLDTRPNSIAQASASWAPRDSGYEMLAGVPGASDYYRIGTDIIIHT